MSKFLLVLYAVAVLFVAESYCFRSEPRIILPTFRPPPRRPSIIIAKRDAGDEPLWLNQGDIPRAPSTAEHPVLPTIIDDVKLDPNRRYARSFDSRSSKHHGGGHSSSGGSRDTGATHPGYNRRNA